MSTRLLRGIAIAAFAIGLPLAVLAQVIPTQGNNGAPSAQAAPQHQHGGYMRAMRALNLSDGQKSQIQSITQNYRQQNASLDQTSRRANMKQMRADILGVLTPAQRTQLRQMREQNPRPAN